MINVYTDASFCWQTNTGYYGYWIETEQGDVHKGSGRIANATDAVEAEMWAIYLSLSAVALMVEDHKFVTFWTDSFQGCQMLYNGNDKFGDVKRKINLFNDQYIHAQFAFNYLPRNSTPQLKWCDEQSKQYGHG